MSDIQPSKRSKRLGRPPKLREYSIMIRDGQLPEKRRYLRPFIEETRAGMIADLGPTEEALTTSQRVLIDRALCLLMVTRCIEEQAAETGVFPGGQLDPVMIDVYPRYVSNLRQTLQALGIDKKAKLPPMKLEDYVVRAVHDPRQDAPQAQEQRARNAGSGDLEGQATPLPGPEGGGK